MTQPQDECGYDFATTVLENLRIIGELPQRARSLFEGERDEAHRRPDETTWSPAGYLWHLVDVYRLSADWFHDMRTIDHPTHFGIDNDVMAAQRHYDDLSVETGLWALESVVARFVAEAARTDPLRTCDYHDWKQVTAGEALGLLTHEAVHHYWDMQRILDSDSKSNRGS